MGLRFTQTSAPVPAIAMFQKEQDYGLPEATRVADADHPWGAVHLHGAAADRLRVLGGREVAVSLSHSQGFAVAVVVVTGP